MKFQATKLAHLDPQDAKTPQQLLKWFKDHLGELEAYLVQDLSHINPAAAYAGHMTMDKIDWIKEREFRLSYSYAWQIGFTCAGVSDHDRVQEKVRFTLTPEGEVHLKLLQLDKR